MSVFAAVPDKAGPARSRFMLRKAQIPVIGGFLVLLAIAAGLIVLTIGNHDFNQSVLGTLRIRGVAYRLLITVQDAETGERGFLLTDNPAYLRPYDEGRAAAPKILAELQGLVTGRAQDETMKRLTAAVNSKLEDLALTVGLGKKGERDEALKHVNLNTGNDLMEAIRVEVSTIQGQEEARRAEQLRAAETNAWILAGAALAGLLSIIALAAFTLALSKRATDVLVKAQDNLRLNNENLESMVAERVSELQAANDEIQRFAYIVSHDLRAPLVNVMGFTSELDAVRSDIAGLLEDAETQAPQLVTPHRRMAIETDLPEALGFIRTSTAKMDRLINAILKLSREGRRVLTPQPIELRALLEQQGESLSQQLSAREATFTVDAGLPDLVSDRLAVEQIFGNLIENATKYLDPKRPGRIVVSGKTHGSYVRYDIVDNGRGIETKDFERIFELFRRSGEQDQPGEGIGLAYVRNLARRLGGNVSVKSEFGSGSTFTVTLPTVFTTKTTRAAK